MNTPVRQIVKKTLSPRILKSPNSSEFLNSSKLHFDLKYDKSAKYSTDDLNVLNLSPTNTKHRFEQFRKPNIISNFNKKRVNVKSNTKFLSVPSQNYIPSVNTPEREKLLKSDLTNLNLNILGRGSFGTVVQAKYKGKLVALKIIQKKNSSLVFERNAVNLEHPNILPVLIVTSDMQMGRHLVVMENCSVPNMQILLNNCEEDIPFTKYSNWVLDICAALQYCHKRKILHLDVKPKNILVKNDTCILCDFGSSLNLNNQEQKENYLQQIQETGRGTIAYSAPELLRTTSLPTSAADVYSLGITMCHLYTRKVPYQYLDHTHILIYQVVKNGLRPEMTIPQITKASCRCDFESRFRALYRRCWDDKSTDRPTLHFVASCLQQISNDHGMCSSTYN